jgi:hypothetical protein
MKKFNVVAASAVALTAALAGGSAFAHGTLIVQTANYNAAAVANAAHGIITVPWGGLASATYAVTANGVSTSLEVNSRFVVTLPTGFTFNSAPSLTVGGPTGGTGPGATTTTLVNGGIGTNSATFLINVAPIPSGSVMGGIIQPGTGTLSLNQVAIQATGVDPLATPGAAANITVQSTNNATTTNNDAAAVTGAAPTFTSDSGATTSFLNGGGNFVDLSSPSLGTEFLVDGTADSTLVDIGTVTVRATGSLNAAGLQTTLSTADTATLTISGAFTGIASAKAVTGEQTVTVVPTANAITFPGVDVGANNAMTEITLISSETTLLAQNGAPPGGGPGFSVSVAPTTGTSGVTDFLLGPSVTNQVDAVPYTGGQVLSATNFFTGSDAGYTSVLRVSNGGTAPTNLFALVQPYSGGPELTGSLGPALAAGTGTVFTLANLVTAIPGLNLANSGQRATVQVIATGTGAGVTASGLLVNPGGVVDNVN